MNALSSPLRTRAPYRIFDCGGWSDTSFMPGGSGACCNMAISSYVYIDYNPDHSHQLTIFHRTNNKTEHVELPFVGEPKTLAEAAAKALNLPANAGGTITVESDAPQGAGTGGSASYSVALLAALEPNLLQDKHALATLAQELETKWLGNSCGTQDQMGAAYGGISASLITYPAFTHETIEISPSFKTKLEESLVLVYTGESHFSSDMHHTVVKEMENDNPGVVQAFYTLKECGTEAPAVLKQEDLAGYKRVLNKNWQAQKDLHPDITTPSIEALATIVFGLDPDAAFKGSGAGGGGSIGILIDSSKRHDLVSQIRSQFSQMKVWDDLVIDTDGARLL